MRIKRICLNNIRSYESLDLSIPEGSTLLSGDIGSGKTSILLGIEFALFGLQPGQKGSSILRNGAESASVSIEFEIDGKNIIVERTLKKGNKSITQDYSSIEVDGSKRELSVTELKNEILELMEYPKEFSKKQNLLYKFTVYTPQEEMKNIIMQDPETRINTLRHVFGVDRYKKIIENSNIILSKIKEERKIKEALTLDLDKEKNELIKREEEVEDKFHNLSVMEKELFAKKEKLRLIQEEKDEISKKREEKVKILSEIEKTKIMIVNKRDTLSSNNSVINNLKNQLIEMDGINFNPSKVNDLEILLKQKRELKDQVNEDFIKKTTLINSLRIKIEENNKTTSNISKLQLCPTCLQDVNPVHKSNVLNDIESKNSSYINEIKSLELEKNSLTEKLSSIRLEIQSIEKEITNLKILFVKVQNAKEKKDRILDIEKNSISINKDIDLLEKHLEILKSSSLEFSKYDLIFENKIKEFNEALKEERMIEIKIAGIKREVDLLIKQISDKKEQIKNLESVKERAIYLNELENWISKKFIPLVSHIEKNVMIKLKFEFSHFFEEWFNMLVPDSFNARLNDDFTPIIEQRDYEIDYNFLSGGERTAVALAYRLSLNRVINSLLSKLKTKDLVILDEPTDGFSEQQLDKMRDVLQELRVGQLIIVSHEQKIEGFVDNVIKIKKEYGFSGLLT